MGTGQWNGSIATRLTGTVETVQRQKHRFTQRISYMVTTASASSSSAVCVCHDNERAQLSSSFYRHPGHTHPFKYPELGPFILRWWLLETGYRLGPNERSHSLTRLIRADFPAPRTNVHRPENIAEHLQGYRQLTGRNEKGAPQVMSQIRSQAGCGRLGATHTV